jgi:hypothetical protein
MQARPRPSNCTDPVTYDDLARRDPRLETLRQAVRNAATGKRRFCGVMTWYGYSNYYSLREDAVYLAGWCRLGGPPELQTSTAYMTVVNELYYNAMPDCRGRCGCST